MLHACSACAESMQHVLVHVDVRVRVRVMATCQMQL